MKRLWTALCAILCIAALSCAFSLAACSGSKMGEKENAVYKVMIITGKASYEIESGTVTIIESSQYVVYNCLLILTGPDGRTLGYNYAYIPSKGAMNTMKNGAETEGLDSSYFATDSFDIEAVNNALAEYVASKS